VKGAIPGPAGSVVFVRNAVKGGPVTFVPRPEPEAATPDVESAGPDGDQEATGAAPAPTEEAPAAGVSPDAATEAEAS
jgi:hypothetical protein